jgi:hypothetical protein
VLGQRTNVGAFLVTADSADGIVWVRLSGDPGDPAAVKIQYRVA